MAYAEIRCEGSCMPKNMIIINGANHRPKNTFKITFNDKVGLLCFLDYFAVA